MLLAVEMPATVRLWLNRVDAVTSSRWQLAHLDRPRCLIHISADGSLLLNSCQPQWSASWFRFYTSDPNRLSVFSMYSEVLRYSLVIMWLSSLLLPSHWNQLLMFHPNGIDIKLKRSSVCWEIFPQFIGLLDLVVWFFMKSQFHSQ